MNTKKLETVSVASLRASAYWQERLPQNRTCRKLLKLKCTSISTGCSEKHCNIATIFPKISIFRFICFHSRARGCYKKLIMRDIYKPCGNCLHFDEFIERCISTTNILKSSLDAVFTVCEQILSSIFSPLTAPFLF